MTLLRCLLVVYYFFPAVHIDYGNRPESSVEADFVGRYCKSLDIKFRCRKIDEVTRGVTSRDDYGKLDPYK